MKSIYAFVVTTVILLSLVLPNALAQSTQTSYTVTLNWFTLHVTYPSEVMPGDPVTVNVQGTPNGPNVYLQNLTAVIYYVDASGLHQLTSQTLVSNPANVYGSGSTGSFSKNLTVTVPQDAPRTALMAVFTETTQYNNYYSNFYYGPYPFSYWNYGNPLFYSFYPAYTTSTDQGISPLSYIEATTPEYVALQSEYETLQQQLNQTKAQNQQLQTTITQQNATISQLNEELTSVNATAQTYEAVAAVFIIIAVALVAFSAYTVRNKAKMKPPSDAKDTK